MAIQLPRQRIANEKFNKKIEKNRKYGKPKVKKDKDSQSKIRLSNTWVALLLFLLVGGGVLEIFSLLF